MVQFRPDYLTINMYNHLLLRNVLVDVIHDSVELQGKLLFSYLFV